jgi:hypothetical protein
MDTLLKSVGAFTLVFLGQLTVTKFISVTLEGIQSSQVAANNQVEISTPIYQPYDYGGPDYSEGSATR